MGTFAAYTFESGIYLLAGYLIYKWLLSTENQPVFNRFALLSIYVIAFTAPLLHLPDFGHLAAGTQTGVVDVEHVAVTVAASSAPMWARLIIPAYFSGVIIATIFTVISFVRLFAVLRKGELHKTDSYYLVLLDNTKFATFSWWHYIAMSRADYEDAGDTIIIHETAHLRLHHWLDLLLAQIVTIILWYNPASWLMRAELRSVHEYQADAAVLESGVDARQYQLLLTKKAVGQRFPSLANSLNHSKLKNRITMMCNQKSSPARRLRALAIAPAFLLAAVAVNTTPVAHALGTLSTVSLGESKGSENNPAVQTTEATATPVYESPEVMPEFLGGMSEMFQFLAKNMSYPADAAARGEEGRVVLKFIVNQEGKPVEISVMQSVSPELDAEAIRVVSIMPQWKPGMVDGEPVRCNMVLPVTFKLQKNESTKATTSSTYKGDTIYPLEVVGYGAVK